MDTIDIFFARAEKKNSLTSKSAESVEGKSRPIIEKSKTRRKMATMFDSGSASSMTRLNEQHFIQTLFGCYQPGFSNDDIKSLRFNMPAGLVRENSFCHLF